MDPLAPISSVRPPIEPAPRIDRDRDRPDREEQRRRRERRRPPGGEDAGEPEDDGRPHVDVRG